MRLPLRSLLNPGSQSRDFFLGKRFALRPQRRHARRGIRRRNTFDDFARRRISRHHRNVRSTRLLRAILGIETQPDHALRFVRSMTHKAPVGKYRTNVTRKVHRRLGSGERPSKEKDSATNAHANQFIECQPCGTDDRFSRLFSAARRVPRHPSRSNHFAAFRCIFSYSGFHSTLIICPGAIKHTRPLP